MKIYIVIAVLFLTVQNAFAFSFTGANPGAVNLARYYNSNPYNFRRTTRNNVPYVYSEQQAEYYGIDVANPNTQYRNSGLYKQNYSNNSGYSQRYGY